MRVDVPTVKVWDPIVRIGHWLLALSVAAAWLTREGWSTTHEIVGYVALAIVGVRVTWGFVGPVRARFSDCVRSPLATLRYVGKAIHLNEPRYVGHNPIGAWMILGLLLVTAATSASGWLYTTDRYWGVEWVENLHSTLANILLAFATLHVAGILMASFRHRENLIGSMLHGRKRAG